MVGQVTRYYSHILTLLLLTYKSIIGSFLKSQIKWVDRVTSKCAMCLGELKKGVEELRGEVVPAGAAQQVGDHQEAPACDHLLLDAGGPLHKLADKLHEGGAEDGVRRCLLLRPAHRVVQLGEQWEQHLDPADGVEGGVDRARHDCRHVLSEGGGQ